MIYEASMMSVVLFFAFVGVTLGISFYMGSRAKSNPHSCMNWKSVSRNAGFPPRRRVNFSSRLNPTAFR